MSVRRHRCGRRPGRAIVAASAAAVALVGGCGLPDDREPRVITAQEAPLDLSESAAGNASAFGDAEATLYFVREGALAPVPRATRDDSLVTALEALLNRPTTGEETAGLRTEIPAETQLIDAPIDAAGIATISLECAPDEEATDALPSNCGLRGVEGTAQLTAFAQLVCTATRVDGVEAVLFFQDGTAQPAPVDAGTSPNPVRCTDYLSVREPS